jgi:CheY-like chemotaxis protein
MMPVDVVLLDIGLPDMDGWQVARAIRSAAAGGPLPLLVALTGYPDSSEDQDSPFAHHVVKPADQRELLEIIRQAPRQT